MTRRKSFSRKERARLFKLYNGECYLCQGKIHVGEAWEIEHLIAWELTRDDSDENIRLAHVKCHKPKTAADIRCIRKADRQRDKHLGVMKTRKGRPMPGTKASGWKRKMDGTVERRT